MGLVFPFLCYRFFIILVFIFSVISCDTRGGDRAKGVHMGQLEHGQRGEDYEFVLSSAAIKQSPLVWQNRVEKVIYVKLDGIKLESSDKEINIGLVRGFSVKDGLLSIKLLRTLRYESELLSNNNFVVRLKNVKFLSSMEPKSSAALKIHNNSFVIDLHNDLAFHLFVRGIDLSSSIDTEVGIKKLRAGGVNAIFFAIWVPSFYMGGGSSSYGSRSKLYAKKKEYVGKPFDFALSMIRGLKEEIIRNSDALEFVSSTEGIRSANSRGKVAALIGLEGLHSLEGRHRRLDILYDEGVRYIGLTWSNTNEFADSSTDVRRHRGLSSIGKELVKSCVEKGLLIDISHSSDETVYDVMEITGGNYPLIASHSGVKGIKKHKRNLGDDIIKLLHKSNGVIGVIFHNPFISKVSGKGTIEDVLDQIDYIAESSSVDNIAFGSDFDGFISTPVGLEDMSKFPNLSVGLYNRGYLEIEIEKILGGNFIRVLRSVESLATAQ